MFHLQMAVVRVFITVEKWLLFIRSELSRATNVPPVILIVGPWAFGVLEGRQVARWLASRAEWRADVLRDRTHWFSAVTCLVLHSAQCTYFVLYPTNFFLHLKKHHHASGTNNSREIFLLIY